MSNKTVMKPLSVALGAAFVASLAGTSVANAAENPFGMKELSSGYMVAEEGKCGGMKEKEKEGKCGGEKKESAEGKCGEGKCGEKRKANEGKCGEGKCGGEKKESKEGKCGGSK
jgi:uncharacterized low-complexity protein